MAATSSLIRASLDQNLAQSSTNEGWIPKTWRKPLMLGLGAVAAGGVCYVLIKQWQPSSSRPTSAGGDHLDALIAEDVKSNGAPVAVVPPSKRKTDTKEAPDSPKVTTPSKPPTAAELKVKGNECFKLGKYKEAIEYYSKAIEAAKTAKSRINKKDDLATYHQNRAAAHEKLNDLDNVVADCSSAIEHNKTYVKAYQRRAKIYDQQGNHQGALVDLTTVCILESFSNASTLTEADRVLKSLADGKAKEVLKGRGEKYTVPLSTCFVDSYLMSFCEDPILNELGTFICEELVTVLNSLKFKQYKGIPGASIFQELSNKDDPTSLPQMRALALRATFHVIHGNTKRANVDFDDFLSRFEKLEDDVKASLKQLLINVYIKRGSFHMQLGKKDEAMADFQLAVDLDPNNADIYHHRGQLRMLLGEIEPARSDFQKTCDLRPDFEVARVQFGYAEYRFATQGESTATLNNSILKFENLVKDFPNCAEGYALLGQVYAERESFDDAKEMFQRALKISPHNVNVYVHMGLLHVAKSENYEEAKSIIQKAIDIDPHCEFAYETIGNLEVQRGNIGMAIEYFDRALNLARTELELIHIIGMREAACAQISAAKQIGYELPGAQAGQAGPGFAGLS